MQADVFPDDGHFGSMFYNMARMSAMGLKQITLSTGGNTAGGAYIVFMACQSVMIDQKAYSFLGGPPLVKMATGEEISAEDLGGARVHTQVSGGADHFCSNQEEAIARVRAALGGAGGLPPEPRSAAWWQIARLSEKLERYDEAFDAYARMNELRRAAWDPDAESWTAPFVMAAVNTRVVRRSNALMGWACGRDFRYSEALMTGRGAAGWARAAGLTAGLGGFVTLASVPPTRALLERLALPKPGEGPSKEERERGFFDRLRETDGLIRIERLRIGNARQLPRHPSLQIPE